MQIRNETFYIKIHVEHYAAFGREVCTLSFLVCIVIASFFFLSVFLLFLVECLRLLAHTVKQKVVIVSQLSQLMPTEVFTADSLLTTASKCGGGTFLLASV